MNLRDIKSILSEDNQDVDELDILLSIEHLLSKHRSVFLDQKIYDMSPYHYGLLKGHIIKALDVAENKSGELVNYSLIPIVLEASQKQGYSPIVENIDPLAIKNVLVKSGLLEDDVVFSSSVMPRRTVFGGNAYATFDAIRDALKSKEESYVDESVLIAESSNQFIFYIVVSEKHSRAKINHEEWYDKLKFIQARISKCCGTDVQINPPIRPSEEIYASLFSDAWSRLCADVDFQGLSSIDSVSASIFSKNRSASLCFYSHLECVASIELGKLTDIEDSNLKYYLRNFAVEHELNCNDINIIDDNLRSRNSSIKKKSPTFRVIK